MTPIPLVHLLEREPVGTFAMAGAADPELLLPRVFGPKTTVRPMYHCAPVGGWESGWTVLVPHEGVIYGYAIRQYGNDTCEAQAWANLSAGGRIDLLTASVDYPTWDGFDLPDLILTLLGDVHPHPLNEPTDRLQVTRSFVPWLLAHAFALLGADDVAATWTLAALRFDDATLTAGRQLIDMVRNVTANQVHVGATVPVAAKAALRCRGVELSAAELEELAVPGALMTFPRETWDSEAERLIAAVHTRG